MTSGWALWVGDNGVVSGAGDNGVGSAGVISYSYQRCFRKSGHT